MALPTSVSGLRVLPRERLRTVTCYTFLFFSLAILRA